MSDHIAFPVARLDRTSARDGAPIAYQHLRGSGSHRFALVHSLAMDHRFWNRVAPRLQEAGDVLLIDCRGHGASSKSGAPYSAEQFADDLADVLDAIGWRDAIIGGASMGGCVALAFAAANPERTSGLALIDTTASYGETAARDWEDRARKAFASGLETLVPFQKSRWFSQGFADAHPQIVQESVAIFLGNDLPAYSETCRMLGRFDKRAALPKLTMPTHIVVGSEDYATPPVMAAAMRDAIPRAVLEQLDGAAHLTPIERADDVARIILSLAEVEA